MLAFGAIPSWHDSIQKGSHSCNHLQRLTTIIVGMTNCLPRSCFAAFGETRSVLLARSSLLSTVARPSRGKRLSHSWPLPLTLQFLLFQGNEATMGGGVLLFHA